MRMIAVVTRELRKLVHPVYGELRARRCDASPWSDWRLDAMMLLDEMTEYVSLQKIMIDVCQHIGDMNERWMIHVVGTACRYPKSGTQMPFGKHTPKKRMLDMPTP